MRTPTILARLPTQVTSPADIKTKSSFDRKKIEKRHKALFDQRIWWEGRWKDIRDYQNPWRGMFDDTADYTNPARKRDHKMINGTPLQANQIMASGIMSGLTPPSRPWFRLNLADRELGDYTPIRQWLDEAQDLIYSVLGKSNFYNSVHSAYSEIGFGQAPLILMPHQTNVLNCRAYTIGSYALGIGADGTVNTFARKWKMNAFQLVEKFGLESCPENVQRDYRENRAEKEYEVNWILEPNDDRVEWKGDRMNMPYRSVYWVTGSQEHETLYIGGFQEWPVPVARWDVIDLLPYAFGPGWYAEGDSKMLQVLEKDLLTAVELTIKPPLSASANTVKMGVNIMPGGITINDNTAGTNNQVEPLFQVALNIRDCQEKIRETENKIKRYYSADLFLMLDELDKGQMTAREVMERSQEKMQQLGPVVERLQSEFLSPIIERVFGMLTRAGALPPLPQNIPEATGQEIKVEYTSPLAQAQKMSGLTAIEQGVAFVGQMANIYPDVILKIDEMEAVDRYLDALGVPASIVRPDDVVREMQAQRQQAQQQQQMAQMMVEGAQPISQAVKNLNDVSTNGNPAMAALLGLPQGSV